MQLARNEFISDFYKIPAYTLSSPDFKTTVIVIHGYGGNKEELLGLSFRISELGFNVITFDLRGHGQNINPLNIDILKDVNYLFDLKRQNGKIISIGHSLGGRLSLVSNANVRIGISPALDRTYSDQTKTIINNLRKYRVTEIENYINWRILNNLPVVDSSLTKSDFIIYGSRDVPEIIKYCEKLKNDGKNVIRINNALHGDIFLLEETIIEISQILFPQLSRMA